eukprot:COSAG04_NODE_1063_length_8493_cov_6.486181_6_plen_233_part_00
MPPSPNACPGANKTAHTCPCYAASNAFGAVALEHNPGGSGCNVSDYPTRCLTDVEKVAAALQPLPAGQRAISWEALYLPRVVNGKLDRSSPAAVWDLDPTGGISPWADEWKSAVAKRVGGWFGAYKAAGGPPIDVVYYDLESFTLGFGHVFAKGENNSAVFGPWLSDPRWPALLSELNKEGAPFGVSFDDMAAATNTSCCSSEGCEPGCDTTDYHPCEPSAGLPTHLMITQA